MNAKNCPRCGKLFNMIISPVCPTCEKIEEEVFDRVRKYIEDNPECSLHELARETKTSAKLIIQYIKDGRLIISEGMQGEITCEKCYKPIVSGHYCEACALEVNKTINSLFSKKLEIKNTGIMHVNRKR